MNWIPCLGNHYISAALFVPDSSNRAVMLCTSSFIDVMFAHNGWEQMTQKGTCTEPLNGGQQAAKIWHCCIYSNWPTRWQHWTGGRCQVCKLWLALFFVGFYAIRWGIKITVVFVVFFTACLVCPNIIPTSGTFRCQIVVDCLAKPGAFQSSSICCVHFVLTMDTKQFDYFIIISVCCCWRYRQFIHTFVYFCFSYKCARLCQSF